MDRSIDKATDGLEAPPADYDAARRFYRAEVLTGLAKQQGFSAVYVYLTACEAEVTRRARIAGRVEALGWVAAIVGWAILTVVFSR